MLASLGPASGPYQAVLLLHILAVIVGFGPLFVSGLYASRGRDHGGAVWATLSEVTGHVTRMSLYSIYLVPIFGFALVGMSDKVYKFSDGWISAAIGLYVIDLAALVLLQHPSQRKLDATLSQESPDHATIELLEKRMAMASGINHLLVLVILWLMVVKP